MTIGEGNTYHQLRFGIGFSLMKAAETAEQTANPVAKSKVT